MDPRMFPARSGAVLKVRPGKSRSQRARHVGAKRRKKMSGPESSESRPSTSQESPTPSMSAVLAEEGVCVLLLGPGQKLTFTGKCLVTCLYGSVEVLGLTINSNQTPYEVFSPNTHSPLTITALRPKKTPKTRKENRREAVVSLRGYLSLERRRTVMTNFKSSCSILLMERLEEPTSSYIQSHPEYAKIFSAKPNEKFSSTLDDSVLLSAGIENRDPDSAIVMPEKAVLAAQTLVDACLEEHDGCPVILVCGPQNVGKSTFNRYLINQLIDHIPCVGYLECDLGQSEFTPPGSISLLNVTKPILGPPFTHQSDVHKMVFFGDTSCEQEIERFIESVKYVITSYRREQPLIVNTMGWIKGFGLLLLIDLIRLLSPSHIVQMVAEGGERMEPLTPEYVKSAAGYMTKASSDTKYKNQGLDSSDEEEDSDLHFRPSLGHELLQVENGFSGAGGTETVRCHGWILRDLAMLGYIGKLQQFEQIIPLNSFVPYEVLFRELTWRKRVYHILAPIPPAALRLVNCLQIGNISIPHSIFRNQPGINGEIPYVTSDYDFTIYGSGKMKRKKHLKRRKHL